MIEIENLKPFPKFCYTIGMIPSSYKESLTYEEQLIWFCSFLQDTVIPTVNNNGLAVEELQNLYVELKSYVDNYFENLDVQNEINIKLDTMAENGTLLNLIKPYIDPLFNEQNERISTFENNVNSQINSMNELISSVTSGTPLVASSTSEMTETDRIYVNTSDGKWYYYNGTNWQIGGTYQTTGIGEYSIGLDNLKNEVINDRYTQNSSNILNPFTCLNNKGITSATGQISDNNLYWITDKIYVNNGEYLRCLMSNNYNNSQAKAFPPYKAVYYNNNDEVIEAFTNINIFHATTDGYFRLQFAQSNISFIDRFKIVCDKSNSEFLNKSFKNFYPYTFNNKNNIFLNINENDFENSSKFRLVGLNEITLNDFELGTVYTNNGTEDTASNRIKSKKILSFPIGSKIKSDGTVSFRCLFYDNNDNYLNQYTDWLTNEYMFSENKRCIIIGSLNPATEINDINDWFSHISFKSNIEYIIDFIKNYNFIDNNFITYLGEKINLDNKFYYEPQTFSNLGQDACQYNNKLFIFNSQGKFNVYDLINKTLYGLFDLDENETIKPHCNSAFFGNKKYAEGDLFPILYVNAYNTSGLPLGTLYAHRILFDSTNNEYTTQLIQTIKIGFTNEEIWTIQGDIRPYGNFILNSDTNELYAFTLRGENTRFFKFNMPEIEIGDTILNTNDIIEMFDTEILPYIQGCTYSNNQIFALNGNDSIIQNSSYLNVINLNKKSITNKIPLSSLMNEPEAIFKYNQSLYIAGFNNFYKFN